MRGAFPAIAMAACALTAAGAQTVDSTPLPEWRLDATPFTGGQLGAGMSVPVSNASRLGGVIAVGAIVDGPGTRATARLEVHGRFSADPFQELRYAPYAVAGGMLACADDRHCRPLIVIRVGVEGPARAGFIPGIELGLGDGVQLGFVIRQSRPGRR